MKQYVFIPSKSNNCCTQPKHQHVYTYIINQHPNKTMTCNVSIQQTYYVVCGLAESKFTFIFFLTKFSFQ